MAAERATTGRTGNATARRIVEAALETLSVAGIRDFTMRGIAKRAGVRLSGVQYYFPTMEALVLALIDHVVQRYRDAYAAALTGETDAAARLKAVIAFNLSDIAREDTRRLFVNLWPLLETQADYSGSLTLKLYAPQFALLGERILDLRPGIGADEARRRAELISAVIEGLFVTLPPTAESSGDIAHLQDRVIALCLAIATGDA
ncbi:TetR/AcrR family transcriptional regulator [Sphingomonas flavalba]|uniref:TetR/AcrR family transcriptional regulator n=1 Tax=Sphingomonas flavalba TaxID=2559804 RepID=UPI00109DE5F1|nr:TetR/AcrR family transcriptional regulator [Sphingomonas flavalba]